ncbi:MAG: hypothetical protein HUU27_06285, partial [Phycisphaerae bacterium]|nr:hypothetical protein [Phycisphaerae bacterium]
MPDSHRNHDPAGRDPLSELERLISRHLDHEATDADRRRLDRLLHADPRARAYFEESAALDRELHQALGLRTIDPGLLEKMMKEAASPEARAAKLRELVRVWPDDFALALKLL